MAKAVSKTPGRSGRGTAGGTKPKAGTTRKAVIKGIVRTMNGSRHTPAAEPDTREDLVAEMGQVLDEVDRVLSTMEDVYWSYPQGPLAGPREQVNALYSRMSKLSDIDGPMTPRDIFELALQAEPGTAPSLARPGRFLEWIGYVPVLIRWGGFIERSSDLLMVDPAEKWITSSGYLSCNVMVGSGKENVRELFRDKLIALTQLRDFDLHDVGEWGRNKAIALLAASDWLRRALDAGPVDPIPLPRKLLAVQKSLFTT